MTKTEFTQIIFEISPYARYMAYEALPKLAEYSAIHAFVNEIDNEYTDVLREQLNYLYNNGTFELEDF